MHFLVNHLKGFNIFANIVVTKPSDAAVTYTFIIKKIYEILFHGSVHYTHTHTHTRLSSTKHRIVG